MFVFVVVAALLVAGSPSHADMVSLPAAQDNTLYESGAGNVSNGAGPTMFSGRNQLISNSVRRALLRFDIALAIPAGSTIQSVTLGLSMSQTSAGASPVSLHRALASWGEGASNGGASGGTGAAATAGDATWLHRFFPGTPWGVAGGDFAAPASASILVDQVGAYLWGSTPGMVVDVQGWLDVPGSNFGWLLRGDESTQPTVKRFDTRESTVPALRPVLTVTFEPPGTPVESASWGRVKILYR